MADYNAQPGRVSAPQPDVSAAQRESDQVDVHAGLTGARNLIAVLSEVAQFAQQTIPGVKGADVTLTDSEDESVETWQSLRSSR